MSQIKPPAQVVVHKPAQHVSPSRQVLARSESGLDFDEKAGPGWDVSSKVPKKSNEIRIDPLEQTPAAFMDTDRQIENILDLSADSAASINL